MVEAFWTAAPGPFSQLGAPGFARCRFEPYLGLLQWAKGVVPTPRGDVRVSWRRGAKGRLTFKIETAAGMPAELVLPRPTDAADLVLDGRKVVTAGQPPQAEVRLDAGFIRVTLPGGTHQGELGSGATK
ncbi:MAG: hypothetical protein NTY19_31435 [Planctomycetota bacterium]|nr:hypothetical protein [Planctomycetota bacterium]